MYLSAKTILNARSLLSLVVILAASSFARADVFVDIPEVMGEAQEARHVEWIVCETLSFGLDRSSTATGMDAQRTSSAARFSEITLRRRLDVSSAQLFVRAANGQKSRDAVIELTRKDGDQQLVVLRLVLSDVQVTSYSVESSDNGSVEIVKLNFSKISMTYKTYNGDRPAGDVTASWDIAANREA